jgi:DNA-directed RNA polymerase specialized sigma24 family protein
MLYSKMGVRRMTQEQLEKHLRFCRQLWNGYGEDIFQEACLIALQRYKTLNNVNQSLFKLLCKEAARKLLKHQKYEIPFSQLQGLPNFSNDRSNELDDEIFENTLIDPHSEMDEALFDKVQNVSFSDKKQLFQLPLFFTPHNPTPYLNTSILQKKDCRTF